MSATATVLHFDAEDIKAQCPELRKDDTGSIFFARELEHVLTREREVKYATLRCRDFIPINTEAGPGAETITFRSYDSVGMAKFISDYAKDFPNADAFGKEGSVRVKSLGAGFQYTIQELRAAQQAGRSLDDKRQRAASKAMRTKENKVAFLGDTTWGFTGFFKNDNVTVAVLPADGTGSSKAWETKTNDQIIRDVALMTSTPQTVSDGVESVDTLLLPLSKLLLLKNRRMGTGDGTLTLYKYLVENNPGLAFDWTSELLTAGSGSATRMMSYRRDPEVVEMHIPQDLEFFTPQQEGMAFKVPAHERFGGVVFYYPIAAVYADGL